MCRQLTLCTDTVIQDANSAFSPGQSLLNFCSTAASLLCRCRRLSAGIRIAVLHTKRRLVIHCQLAALLRCRARCARRIYASVCLSRVNESIGWTWCRAVPCARPGLMKFVSGHRAEGSNYLCTGRVTGYTRVIVSVNIQYAPNTRANIGGRHWRPYRRWSDNPHRIAYKTVL